LGYKINYTGDGGGKTVAALGLALRAWGHGQRVVVVQFMKGRPGVGEVLASKSLSGFTIHQFGRQGFVDLKKPALEDKLRAGQGLRFAVEILKSNPPGMLVLDEVNLAVKVGLLKESDVVSLVKRAPKDTIVVLTGRGASKALLAACDFVTKIEDVKSIPVKKRKGPVAGFEY
jgi:cob(I)alamin adenosyltransferase